MQLLVTGGAGFVGSHLCDRLVEEGHDVIAVDDLSLGRLDNIAHLSGCPHFQFRQLNVLDGERLCALLENATVDAVFHLAANSDISRGVEDPTVDLDRTFLTTFEAARAAREYEIGEFVFTSSSAIYGQVDGPISEETGPALPKSFYGAGKLASEGFLSAFASTSELALWILRFPNVVGERATHGVIYDFVRKLEADPDELVVLGDGTQCKPYIYVKDLVDAIVYTWQHSRDQINCYNIGVDSRTTVREIARMVIEEMGLRASIRYTGGRTGWPGDVAEYAYDLSRLHALGWHCPRSSDEAVRLAIQRILEHDFI